MPELKPIEIPKGRLLTKEDLPTHKQLRILLSVKGREALMLYAWRSSQRILPLISRNTTFPTIWKSSWVKYVVSLVRANILLSPLALPRERYLHAILKNYRVLQFAGKEAATSYDVGIANISTNISQIVINTSIVSFKPEDVLPQIVISNASQAEKIATNLKSQIQSHLIRDFNLLVEQKGLGVTQKTPVWCDINRHPFLQDIHDKFLAELNAIGLGFLGEDIAKLWRGEQITEERLARYADTSIGEDIWGNAKALERFIVGAEKAENNAVRVMLVGPGGAGKTSLRDLILQRETNPIKRATRGVEHHNHQAVGLEQHNSAINLIDDKIANKARKLDLYLWDFGGQSIFHNLHRGFFRKENCVYVLVVDSRHEQAPDEWLAQIEMLIGEHIRRSQVALNIDNNPLPTEFVNEENGGSLYPEANLVPVLIVTNSYEGIHRKQNQSRLLREYRGLLHEQNFFEFPCIDANNKNFDAFMARLLTLASDTKSISELSAKAITSLEALLENQPFVSRKQFQKKLQQQDIDIKEWETIKTSLSDLGRLVAVGNDQFCLDPGWIVDVAYTVINHQQIQNENGLMAKEALLDLCEEVIAKQFGEEDDENQPNDFKEDTDYSKEAGLVLNFLKEQHATIKLTETDNPHYFFPDAAKSDEPHGLAELLQAHRAQVEKHNAEQADDAKSASLNPLTVEYQFATLPLGFRTKFVVAINKTNRFKLQLPDHVWRDGLRAEYVTQQSNIDIWVDYQLAKQHISISFFNYQDPEALTSPITTLHNIIKELEGAAVPILTNGFEHLTPTAKAKMFEGVGMYKQMEEGGAGVTNYHTYWGNIHMGNIIDFSNANISQSQIAAGTDNEVKAENVLNITLSQNEKDVILKALMLAGEKASPESQNVIDALTTAVSEDKKPEQKESWLNRLWNWAKEGKDAVEISGLITTGLAAVPSIL